MKDPFSYSGRWDSVGFGCSQCRHFVGPFEWPDKRRVSKCALQGMSLAIELNRDGYMNGEWFCRDFDGNGNPISLQELEGIRAELQPDTLYHAYGRSDGQLDERSFGEVRNYRPPGKHPNWYDEEFMKARREEIVKTAREMLNRQLPLIDGSRVLRRLGWEVCEDNDDPDFKIFDDVASKAEFLPSQRMQHLWTERELAEKNREGEALIANFEKDLLIACNKLITRFEASA